MCERGIQLSDSDKGEKKVELLDLCKKAAAMKQIQLAASAQDRKSCWRRNYKQVWANLQLPKFWMLGCTTSVTFQSFRSASTCSLAKPGLSFLLSSLNFLSFFFFFLIRSRAYCNLQNDLNDRNWKSFTCEMSSKSIISKIAK